MSAQEVLGNWGFATKMSGYAAGLPVPELKEVLIAAGANASAATEADVQESLLKGTNEGQSYALEQIWGELRFSYYKQRVYGFVAGYEAAGKTLPKGNLKASSAIKLLGLLTAVAFGNGVTAAEIEPYISAMVQNGIDWDETRKPKEERIQLPIWRSASPDLHPVPVLPKGYLDYFFKLLSLWMGKNSDVE